MSNWAGVAQPDKFTWKSGDIVFFDDKPTQEAAQQAPVSDEQLAIEAKMKQVILDYMHDNLTADEFTERIEALYQQATQHGREIALQQVKEVAK